MAIQTSATLNFDGVRNTVMTFCGVSDGSGAERGETKVDTVQLAPQGTPSIVKINRIQYCVRGGAVKLSWADANAPADIIVLTGTGEVCAKHFGGIANSAPDPTGNILLDTIGFETGSSYSLIIEMQKS